jgi:hypothetical protein
MRTNADRSKGRGASTGDRAARLGDRGLRKRVEAFEKNAPSLDMMAASSLTSAAATMAEPNRTGLAAAMTAKEMALADTTAPDPPSSWRSPIC